MTLRKILVTVLVLVGTASLLAQQPRGRRDANLTPEQQAQREKQRAAQAIADGVRPIEALDTVWIEEQTWMETRDAIKAGKTTAATRRSIGHALGHPRRLSL